MVSNGEIDVEPDAIARTGAGQRAGRVDNGGLRQVGDAVGQAALGLG